MSDYEKQSLAVQSAMLNGQSLLVSLASRTVQDREVREMVSTWMGTVTGIMSNVNDLLAAENRDRDAKLKIQAAMVKGRKKPE